MANACLGKVVDDEITVRTPSGEVHWYIVKIEYNIESQSDSHSDSN